MKICVCVKQVPDSGDITADPVTGNTIRTGDSGIMNIYDGYALEAAVRIKEQTPGTEIMVISMGPPSAAEVLRVCLAIGADRACLLSDPAFSGSDSYATAHILSHAIRSLEEEEGRFDCIFCGQKSTDGETGQVGPELAEQLGYPCFGSTVSCSPQQDGMHIWQQGTHGRFLCSFDGPLVAAFTNPGCPVRQPTLKGQMTARRAAIAVRGMRDISGLEPADCGMAGSRTQVIEAFAPENGRRCQMLDPAGDATGLQHLTDILLRAAPQADSEGQCEA